MQEKIEIRLSMTENHANRDPDMESREHIENHGHIYYDAISRRPMQRYENRDNVLINCQPTYNHRIHAQDVIH